MFAWNYVLNSPIVRGSSQVTSLYGMFYEAWAFDQPSVKDFDTSSVTDMDFVFGGYNRDMAFNQDLRGWDVREVTTVFCMFQLAASYAHPIEWDTPSLQVMGWFLYGAKAFVGPLLVDFDKVTSMQYMLRKSMFDDPSANLWRTPLLEDMRYAFGGTPLNQPLTNLDDEPGRLWARGAFAGCSLFARTSRASTWIGSSPAATPTRC